jgi:hypothetical protein
MLSNAVDPLAESNFHWLTSLGIGMLVELLELLLLDEVLLRAMLLLEEDMKLDR